MHKSLTSQWYEVGDRVTRRISPSGIFCDLSHSKIEVIQMVDIFPQMPDINHFIKYQDFAPVVIALGSYPVLAKHYLQGLILEILKCPLHVSNLKTVVRSRRHT